MTKNEELSELLQGAMITVVARREEGKLELGFDDGTWIEAKTEPGTTVDTNALAGGVVDAVHQGAGELVLQMESGESVEINTTQVPDSLIVASDTGL